MSTESSDNWKIPLYKIYTDDEDLNLITKILKRGSKWAIGPEIEEFEKALANYVGIDYCVAVNSGTSALHAALLAHGLGSNDEIIVPSFSFIATANAVLFVNSKPIFADIEDITFGLDPNSIEKKITSTTRVIIPVDYGGLSCKINEIKNIADDHRITVIEDAAEALGANVNGKKVGSIVETSIFSFCGNKVLTTGEGGAIVTKSKKIYEKLKLIRSHGRLDKIGYFDNPSEAQYMELGYNWRMPTMIAALGMSQLSKLDKIIRLRRDNAKYLTNVFSKYPEIQTTQEPPGYDHIYQMYTIKLEDKKTRDELHNHLLKMRVFSKVYFTPIHLTSFYMEKFGTYLGLLPKTEEISQRVLTLPLYPNMTSEEKEYLADSVLEFFEKKTI